MFYHNNDMSVSVNLQFFNNNLLLGYKDSASAYSVMTTELKCTALQL
jgi:hypothetical protein